MSRETEKFYEFRMTVTFDSMEEAEEYHKAFLEAWCDMKINEHLGCCTGVREGLE